MNIVPFKARAVTPAGCIANLSRQYLQELAILNYAVNTIQARQIDLEQFAGYLERNDVKFVQHVTIELVDRFMVDLIQGEGSSPRTATRKLDTVKCLLKFAVKRSMVPKNVADDVTPPRFVSKRIIAPDEDAILRMIEAIPKDTTLGIRNRAMFTLTYDAALRVSSLCNLDIHDPDNPPRCAIRPNGLIDYLAKGGRSEQSFCDQITLKRIEDWLSVRQRFTHHDSPPALFLSQRGFRIGRATVLAALKKAAKAVGVKGMTMHKLRHRRGGEVTEKVGLRAASSLLGHVNPTVTANVYGHQSAERTRHQVRTLCPVKWADEV